jgi:outer membrane protein TolC
MKRLTIALVMVCSTAHADPDVEKVGFTDAVKRAIARNPDRLVAIAEIDRVRGLLMQATSALLPQVSVGATYTRLEGDRLVADRRAYAASSLKGYVGLDTPIVDLHAFAERKRAHDQVEVTALEADSTKRDVAIATARAYFAAFTAARYLDIATHARELAKAYLTTATERRKGGVGNELDVKRADAQLATDEAQVASATTAKLRAEEALGVLLGSDHRIAAAGEPDLAEPGTDVIDKRADVIAMRRDREATAESAHLDWMNWMPTLHLTGEGFYETPQIDPIPRWGYELDLTLNFQIYDGGLRSGLHHKHRAEYVEAAEKEVGLDRQATSEVRTARAAVDSTRIARDSAQRAAELGGGVLELATLGYTAGTATSLDVVDAERTALDADSSALIAEDNYRQAQLDLLAATGVFP